MQICPISSTMSPHRRTCCRAYRPQAIVVRLLLTVATLWAAETVVANDPASPRVDFQRDIRPILSDKCFFCHGPDEKHREADLRLDTRLGLFEHKATQTDGHEKLVVPGRLDASAVWKRITSESAEELMPPAESGKPLSERERNLIRRWIEQGADWREHWAYSSLTRPTPPTINGQPDLGPVDRFVQSRLSAAGMKTSPTADARTLARRYSFDLTGLPPSSAEVEAFVDRYAQDADAACREFVDRLLTSPHHAERLAMYWLDLVRYADTVGYHGDQEHHISPYRDYVIQAFGDNMPFDRFTREQLAGDLIPDATIEQKIASGYNRLLQTSHEGGVQQKEYLAKYSADRVRNFGAVWLGATLGCSECHDHKFDPLPQRDFYRLAAFFADIDDLRSFKGGDTNPTRREPELDVSTMLVPGEKRRTMITVSIAPRPIRVLARGDWMDESGEVVEPGVPTIFKQIHEPTSPANTKPSRLDLARWVTSRDNPVTSRVFVNRLWRLFYGHGLSRNLEDCGAQGEAPDHPELLDWLAVEFIDSGWNVRHMIRQMVLSQTYRQASGHAETDPENRLLARQSRWRFDAEVIRDNALAVSGLLNREVGGRSVKPYQPGGYYRFLNFPKRDYKSDVGSSQYRRGLYTHWQRAYLHPMLKAFDAPSREECTCERPQSNTPLSALVLLNDPTFVEAARAFAARILREGGTSNDERVRWAWRESLSRLPTDREHAALIKLLEAERSAIKDHPELPSKLLTVGLAAAPPEIDQTELFVWTAVARTIFNLNEFITRN